MTPEPSDNGGGAKRLDSLIWVARRLASMGPAEIVHRLEEQFKRSASKYRHQDISRLISGDPDRLPSIPGLAEGLRNLRDATELREEWRSLAADVQKGRFRALGQTWPDREGPPDWHLDPSTGSHWPSGIYCFDIPYRYEPNRGDIKYVLELNRLQYLQALAAEAALSSDADLRDLVVAHLQSWIADHPPYLGIAWMSGIELALRITSLVLIAALLGGEAISKDLKDRLHLCLAAHGYWLARFPSRFSSANNHRVAEAGGLYLLGSLVPGLRDGKKWAQRGREILQAEVALQFHEDGVGAEQSPTYAAFSLEWFLLCATIGRQLGEHWPKAYWDRMAMAGEHLRAITDQGGHQPRIGDDDEGRVLYANAGEDGYVNTVLGYLAAASGRPELAPPEVTPQLGQAIFGRVAASQRREFEYHSFSEGGYTAVREWRGGEENLWIMDHGPLGYLSIAAHGHADALSIWLHIAGRPVLVDGGTYLYHSGRNWREHFRSTAAHNTMTINGNSSSTMSGAFNWSHKAICRLLDSSNNEEHWLIEAEHDGYVRRHGIRHRRRLERLGESGVRLTDSLHGQGRQQPVEIGFLVAPDLNVSESNGGWLISENDRPLLLIHHTGDLRAEVERGQVEPMRGWHSPSFGQRVASQRLAFSGPMGRDDSAIFEMKTRF